MGLLGWAIQPGDTPDKVREKNRAEEFGMAILGPIMVLVWKSGTFKSAVCPDPGDTERRQMDEREST